MKSSPTQTVHANVDTHFIKMQMLTEDTYCESYMCVLTGVKSLL